MLLQSEETWMGHARRLISRCAHDKQPVGLLFGSPKLPASKQRPFRQPNGGLAPCSNSYVKRASFCNSPKSYVNLAIVQLINSSATGIRQHMISLVMHIISCSGRRKLLSNSSWKLTCLLGRIRGWSHGRCELSSLLRPVILQINIRRTAWPLLARLKRWLIVETVLGPQNWCSSTW